MDKSSSAADSSGSYQPIEEFDVIRLYEEVASYAWHSVRDWNNFDKQTIGQQLVRAADSVNANLVEGDGRFGHQDAIRFFIIARASARETKLWLKRASDRGLIATEPTAAAIDKLVKATRLLNILIKYRRNNSSKATIVRESLEPYGILRLAIEE